MRLSVPAGPIERIPPGAGGGFDRDCRHNEEHEACERHHLEHRALREPLVPRRPPRQQLARDQAAEQPERLTDQPLRSQLHDRRRGGHQHEIGGQCHDDHRDQRPRRERQREHGAPQPRPREIEVHGHAEKKAAARVEVPPAEALRGHDEARAPPAGSRRKRAPRRTSRAWTAAARARPRRSA